MDEYLFSANTVLWVYLMINVLVFVVYGIDKYKAVRSKWRIPERKLMWLAVLGVIGAVTGMLVFRHKIRKNKFRIGIPVIFVVEMFAFYFVYVR